MTQTLWKNIEQFPNYEVSNNGLVRNKKSGKVMKPTKNSSGYHQVDLWNKRGRKQKLIHRLVAKAFINNPNPEELNQVNHKNLCVTDNRVENLEWCNQTYNMRHMITNGHCTLAKLDYRQANEIRELLLLGAEVKRIAEKYGVSPSVIYNIRAGRLWSWIGDASEYLQPKQDTDNE